MGRQNTRQPARRTSLRLVLIPILFGILALGATTVVAASAFAALSSPSFVFTAAGDYGGNKDTAATLRLIGKSNARFHLSLGDNSYREIVPDESWCDFVRSELASSLPFQLVVGNHEDDSEHDGDDGEHDGADGDFRRFTKCLPSPTGDIVGEYPLQYYFDYENLVRFIVISPDIVVGDQRLSYEQGLASSSAYAFEGSRSLKVSLSSVGSGRGAWAYVAAPSSLTPGTTVSLRLFVPSSSPSGLSASIFTQDRNWLWQGSGWTTLRPGSWTELRYTVPSGAVAPLQTFGVSFSASSWSGSVYLDAVSIGSPSGSSSAGASSVFGFEDDALAGWERGDPAPAGEARLEWVANTIDDARATGLPWTVVAMHKNCITIGGKSCLIGPDLMNLLMEKRVDLVLQAHEHSYQRSKQLALSARCRLVAIDDFAEDCVVDDGADDYYVAGAGTVFLIVGTAGKELYDVSRGDSEAGYFATWMGANHEPRRGFARLEVSRSRIEAQFVGSTSTSEFEDRFIVEWPWYHRLLP